MEKDHQKGLEEQNKLPSSPIPAHRRGTDYEFHVDMKNSTFTAKGNVPGLGWKFFGFLIFSIPHALINKVSFVNILSISFLAKLGFNTEQITELIGKLFRKSDDP